MPWTADNPPDVAKNWTAEEKEKCVSAANAVLADGGSDEEAIYACIHAAGKSERSGAMGAVDRLWQRVKALFEAEGITETAERAAEYSRAISMNDIYGQVMDQVWTADEWAWVHDLYVDDGQMIAIVNNRGKLYRVPVVVDGAAVTLGEWQEVEVTFTPTGGEERSRPGFQVWRQADGKYRWVAITETSVLLRVGELDSTELFDSFIAHAEETGEYPTLRFFHDSRLDFGQADWLAREGNCYLASGTLDEEHPIAQAFIRAAEAGELGDWGTSNGFRATADPELWEIAEGVSIPVYREGVHREISLLPEDKAASWFTRICGTAEVVRMRKDVADALKKLFGDEAAAEAFIAQVDETNREIEERGLIARESGDAGAEEGEPEAATEAPATTEQTETTEEIETTEDEDEEQVPAEIELDEEMLEALAVRVRELVDVATLSERLAALESRMAEADAQRGNEARQMAEGLAQCAQRLEALERTDDEKRQQWQADMPRQKVQVTYRPRAQAKPEAEPDAPPSGAGHNRSDLAAKAQATLDRLPARR
jgi:uncharacterized protein YdaT